MSSTKCPLCNGSSSVLYESETQLFHLCDNCGGVFLDRSKLIDYSSEKLIYEEHNNDVEDVKYQHFVSPITSSVLNDFSENSKGLDFGAGTGPVISKVLKDNNYQIKQYDPIFHRHSELLNDKYDYVVCCEVMEHFYHPRKEFRLLNNLLNSIGKLYCMTVLYDDSINFENWYYKNDITHVFFYQQKTLKWIKEQMNFSNVEVNGRLIVFSK